MSQAKPSQPKLLYLEGMGLVGGLLACRLHRRNVAFIWHDREGPGGGAVSMATAYRACTGQAYPTDQKDDVAGLRAIEALIADDPFVSAFICKAKSGFAGRRAPQFHKPEHAELNGYVGNLSFFRQPSYHINARAFVRACRRRFAASYVPCSERRAPRIVTHGFGREEPTNLFWGWSTEVEIRPGTQLKAFLDGAPLALNLRKLPYAQRYLLPMRRSGDDASIRYVVGTDVILQRQPRRLDVAPKFQKALAHMNEAADGQIDFVHATPGVFAHGWRPKPVVEGPKAVRMADGYRIAPQHGSGFRHYGVWLEAIEALLEEDNAL